MGPKDDERISAVRCYLAAATGADGAQRVLAPLLADDAELWSNFARVSGRDAILASLDNPMVAGFLSMATWGEPELCDDGGATLTGMLPEAAAIGGFRFTISFGDNGTIRRVEQEMLRPRPLAPAPIDLGDARILTSPDDVAAALHGALPTNSVPIVAYVDAEGRARLSQRATTQVLGIDQLALWARDANGGLPRSIVERPRVTVMQFDPVRGTVLYFGRARITDDPEERDRIFERSPEAEQNMDFRRNGAAIVIDIDRVEGSGRAGRFVMARDA